MSYNIFHDFHSFPQFLPDTPHSLLTQLKSGFFFNLSSMTGTDYIFLNVWPFLAHG